MVAGIGPTFTNQPFDANDLGTASVSATGPGGTGFGVVNTTAAFGGFSGKFYSLVSVNGDSFSGYDIKGVMGGTVDLLGHYDLFSTDLDNPTQIALHPATGPDVILSNSPLSTGQLVTFTAKAGDYAPPCFVSGTRIRTARGEVPVEDLRVGDEAILASGGREPIVWIGHRRVDCARHPEPWRVRPVHVAPDTFGPGLPARDLWLSPDHAVFAEGVLIPIKALVDGVWIGQVAVTEVTYWHVEIGSHDVLLAEGMPCESYLDTANRGAFENGGEVVALNPDFWSVTADARRCAPLCTEGPEVERVRFLIRNAPAAAA